MKYSGIFKERLGCSNSDEVFNYLIGNLKGTITNWDYFVNWAKVLSNLREVEIDLNILNYLIGKQNIGSELLALLEKHPSVARLIPVLIACREKRFQILSSYDKCEFKYENYDFGKPGSIDKAKVVEFAKKTGFLGLLENKRIKNLVDYVIGVEVGLDSNGRKNRGGHIMEAIVEVFSKRYCWPSRPRIYERSHRAKCREEMGTSIKGR